MARGDENTLRLKFYQLSSRSARLNAELNDLNEVIFSSELVGVADDPTVAAILDGERQLFASRRQSFQESLERLDREYELSEQRAVGLQEQVLLAANDAAAVNEEIQAVRSLLSQRLATTSRLHDLSRAAAEVASRKAQLEGDLLEVRQSIEQADNLRAGAENLRRTEVLGELQTVLSSIQETESRRNTAAHLAERQIMAQRFDPGMLANAADAITSDAISETIVRRLALDDQEDYTRRADLSPAATDEERLRAVTDIVQRNLEATVVSPGSKIEISYRSPNASEAAIVANLVARVFLDGEFEQDSGSSGSAYHGQLLRTARLPHAPTGPNHPVLIGFGLALGLMLGVIAILVREARKRLSNAESDSPGGDRRESSERSVVSVDEVRFLKDIKIK